MFVPSKQKLDISLVFLLMSTAMPDEYSTLSK